MRILLADDHALIRDGIASLVRAWGHEVVGQAADGADAVRMAADLRPELVLMDVRMPVLTGIEATRRIKVDQPGVAIVMLTVSEDEDDLFAAIKAGAQGYLLKNLESRQLRSMLEAVRRGEPAITATTAARIIDELGRRDRETSAPDRLTERELDVLRLVTEGMRNKQIAERLNISGNTVKFHLGNILGKLHAQSRTELAARALREGLVAPQGEERPPG
jgi:DNA-binding NarL/FixJ family response regulator